MWLFGGFLSLTSCIGLLQHLNDTGSCDVKDRYLLVCVAFLYTDVLNGGPVNGPSVQLHIQEGQILSTDSSVFH